MAGPPGALRRPVTCPTLIGRAALREALCRFVDGGASVDHPDHPMMLVVGEAGIGKSRLVAEAKAHAAGRGVRVLEAACFPHDGLRPYAPLIDLARARLRGVAPSAMLGQVGPFARVLHPLLPDLVPRPTGPAEDEPNLDQDRGLLFAALAHCLATWAEGGPVLLVVEDLHWCDDASLDFLLHLTRQGSVPAPTVSERRATEPAVRLLATYRAEDADPRLLHWLAQLDRLRLAGEIALAPLSREEVSAMIATISDTRPLPSPRLIDGIYELSEGNPFWVEELLRASVEPGEPRTTGERRDGHPGSPEQWQIPRSVHDAVYQRVVGLSPQARALVTLAAVIGRRFDATLLQHLAAIDERTLLAALRELVQAQLVVEASDEQFSFRHALTRQALYGELLRRERITHHRAVLAAAETLYGGTSDAQIVDPHLVDAHLDELAYHAHAAEEWVRALTYAERAGQRAARLFAPRAAEQHFTRAIEAARRLGIEPPGEVVSARGRAYEILGEHEAAARDFEAVLERAQAVGDRRGEWQALVDLGVTWSSRSYAMTGEYYRRALAVARELAEHDPRPLARTLNCLGNWHTNLEQSAEAIRSHEEALAAFRRLDDPVGVAETLDVLGMASYLGGDLIRAKECYQEAVTHLRAIGDRRRLSTALVTLGSLSSGGHLQDLQPLAPGDPASALRAAEEGLDVARDIGWPAGEAYALNCVAICGTVQGEYGRADEALRVALTLAESIEHQEWIVHSCCSLALMYLELLAASEARAQAERALTLAREIGSRYWIRCAAALTSRARALDGDLDGADAVLDGLVGPVGTARTCAERLVWWARAELALAQGRPHATLQIVDDLTRSAVGAGPARPIRRLLLLRGEALTALGRSAEAIEALLTARALASERGARPLLWRIDVSLGQAYGRDGQRQQATEAYASARASIVELAAELPNPEARQAFLSRASALLPTPRPVRPMSPRRAAREAFGGLTAREREVAALIGQGKSNREIAEILVLGERTVQTHVSNIFAKLGVNTRSRVAAWAAERGLLAPERP